MKITQQHQDSLAKISKELMLKEPFYGLFLIQLNKSWDDTIPTASVMLNGINFELRINPTFWESLPELHKLGLLKHELLHIAMNHITFFCHRHNDKHTSNIAMDCEINQYIDSSWLPEGGILPESFPELKLELKAGTDYYYNALINLSDDSDSSITILNINSAAQNGKGSAQDANGNKITVPVHQWDDIANADEATQKLIQKQLIYQLENIAETVRKSRGTIPGEIQGLLDGLLSEPPKFDWRGYLRRFAGGSQKVYTKKLRRKYNKRFFDNPGMKIKPRKHILVAIDTSGSVSNNELIEFFSEIGHIHKTGAEVTVIQCDAAIHDIRPYKKNIEFGIVGRGGTAFDPVLDYYNTFRNKYTTLIYLTDGECSASIIPRGKVLWVHSSVSNINDSLPGFKIKLN